MVIASRKLGNCTTAVDEISASTGRKALPVESRARCWADCDRLIEVVYRQFGRCDVLVNNAVSRKRWAAGSRQSRIRGGASGRG